MKRKDEIKYITKYLKRKQRLEHLSEKMYDGLEFVYLSVRMHWVAIVSLFIAVYLFYRYVGSGDWIFFIVSFVVVMLGSALDVRKQFGYRIY